MYRKWFSTFSVFFLSLSVLVAQEACDAIVQTAIQTASENCMALRRNQACYGNTLIDAEAASHVEDFSFAAAGDIVNIVDIASLRLSSNLGNGDWGISLLRLRADMPDSVINDVMLVLTGNVSIENAAYQTILPVTANANTRLRSSPSTETDFNIIMGISAGTVMQAFGRLENGEWLKVQFNGLEGWIAALNVDGDSERMTLPVTDIAAPYYGPMQAFILRTDETENESCEDMPPDGILIQTPEGSGMIEFRINEVSIRLGSTAFFTVTEQSLRSYLLTGTANIAAQGQREFLPAGTFVDVPLSADGSQAAGVPSFPAPYNLDEIEGLPLQLAVTGDEALATVVEPVEDVEAAIAETYISNDYGLIDGWYSVTVISFEQVPENPFIDGYCRSGGTVLSSLNITEFDIGAMGDINWESPTSFTWVNLFNAPSENGGCIVEHRAVWVPKAPQ
jgi:uncharacterized protein YraI